MRNLDKILLKSPEKGWNIRFCYFIILPFVLIISCNYSINLPGKYFEDLYWVFIFFISINFKYYFKKFNDNTSSSGAVPYYFCFRSFPAGNGI